MPEQPLVSIIVPIYNAQDHIARCVESIRRQTYRNLEILLLNDGSQDVSLESARCMPTSIRASCSSTRQQRRGRDPATWA